MLGQLLKFELKLQFQKRTTWVFFLIFFALSAYITVGFSGLFEGTSYDFTHLAYFKINGPYYLNSLIMRLGSFYSFVLVPIFGYAFARDFEADFHKIFFSMPLSKTTFFITRFISAFITSCFILSSVGLAVYLISLVSAIPSSVLQSHEIQNYLHPYLLYILPNVFLFGTLFTAISLIFKNTKTTYTASVLFYGLYLLSRILHSDVHFSFLSSLLDPYGVEATDQLTRYWSLNEKNSQLIPWVGDVLYNRLFWLSISSLILASSIYFFRPLFKLRLKKSKINSSQSVCPKFSNSFSIKRNSCSSFFKLTLFELSQILSRPTFYFITAFAALFSIISTYFIERYNGLGVLPVTYHMVESTLVVFETFIIIVIAIFVSEAVWRDRDKKANRLVDSTPISNRFLVYSKVSSILLIQVLLFAAAFLTCIGMQIAKGYYHFEFGVYAKLLFLTWIPYVFLTFLLFFIHSASKNKHMGHCAFLSLFFLVPFLPQLGIKHRLLQIGVFPDLRYSDMNGLSEGVHSYLSYALYWSTLGLILLQVALLIWHRGLFETWRVQLGQFKRKLSLSHKLVHSSLLSLWILSGAYIYYNTNILNEYEKDEIVEKRMAHYEHTYKKWIDQPSLEQIAAKLEVDFYPKQRAMHASGVFTFENKTKDPVQEILVVLPSRKAQFKELFWDRSFKVQKEDLEGQVIVYHFDEAILPDAKANLEFDLEVKTKGFTNDSPETQILKNGSFFNNQHFFPVIGYQSLLELSSSKSRKKYNLPEKRGMAKIDDPHAIHQNLISTNGGWIAFEATVSTDQDQIPLSPGIVTKKEVKGDRVIYHYKSKEPIINFYAFLSGQYAIREEKYRGVEFQIYYHKAHSFNIERMLDSAKKSLDYYSTHFTPYQFETLKIVEFPRYQNFAQSFPGIIPFSESLGFISEPHKKDSKKFDNIFYITAHELAHQWWGHQVVGARVQGAEMLSESLAQYFALMVQKQEYGEKNMAQFFTYEMDRYLKGRTKEKEHENPLMLSSSQQYICYNKGSLAFYGLKEKLGEEKMNAILKSYLLEKAFQKPPYTQSKDLIGLFEQNIDHESNRSFIEDHFKEITFYSLKLKKVLCFCLDEGYQVRATIDASQQQIQDGKEKEVPFNKDIDIALYNSKDEQIYIGKYPLKTGENQFELVVFEKPSKMHLDPMHLLIDRNSSNHEKKIE